MRGLILALALTARPGTEQQLMTQLNGQQTRWIMPDGGASGAFTVFDGGAANSTACAPLTGGTVVGASGSVPFVPSVVLTVPSTPVVMCVRPDSLSTKWDGGCNQIDTDMNFGVGLQPLVPWYVVPTTGATTVCFSSDAGFIRAPLWGMQ